MQANTVLCTISSFDGVYNFYSVVHCEVRPVTMQSYSVDVPFVFHQKNKHVTTAKVFVHHRFIVGSCL